MNSFSFLLLKLTLTSISHILYILLPSAQVRNVAVMVDAFLCLPVNHICHLNLAVHCLYHFSDFFSQSMVLFPWSGLELYPSTCNSTKLHHAFFPFFWWASTHLKMYFLHYLLFLLILLYPSFFVLANFPLHCSIGFASHCFLFPQHIKPFVHTSEIIASVSMWQVLVCKCILFILLSPVLVYAYYKVINEWVIKRMKKNIYQQWRESSLALSETCCRFLPPPSSSLSI